jgi:tetratricopeptide (TPR) repeat protein
MTRGEQERVLAEIEDAHERKRRLRVIRLVEPLLATAPSRHLKRRLAEAYRGRGVLARQKGRLEDALDHATHAIELFVSPRNLLSRARTYLRLQEPVRASADIERALELSPGSPVARALRSEVMRRLGQIDEALQEVESALEALPNHAPAYATRARIRRAAKQRALAIEDATRASALCPRTAIYAELACDLLFRARDYARAQFYAARAFRAAPRSARLAHDYATCLSWMGDLGAENIDRAIEGFVHAWRLNPMDPNALRDAISLLRGRDRDDEADILEEELRSLVPTDHRRLHDAANQAAARGQFAAAADLWRQASQLAPWNGAYAASSSVAFREAGDGVRAVIEASRAIGCVATEARRYYLRALAYDSIDATDLALADRRRCEDLG